MSSKVHIDIEFKGGVLRPYSSPARGDSPLSGIAGKDKNSVDAAAKIFGNTIAVTAAAFPAPVAVRYAWNGWPEGANLYNADGLPAPQFRSDDRAPPAPAPAGEVGRGPGNGPRE